jgi:hypothetical protein
VPISVMRRRERDAGLAAPRRGESASSRRASDVPILAAYVALGVYAMWPIVGNIERGELYGTDPATSAWSLWWIKECVLHLRNPWHTTWQFAPDGAYLSYYALAPVIGLVWMPVTLAVGPAQAVNVLSLVLPIAAAFATYRLARALAFRRDVAAAVGAFFGFAPITLGRAVWHVMLAAGMLLMPLTLLASIRLRRSARRRDAAILGTLLGITVLVDVSVAPLVFALIALFWLGVAVARGRLPGADALRLAILCVAVTLVIASPQVYFNVVAARTGDYQADPVMLARNYRVFGTDVLAIIRPGPYVWAPESVTRFLDSVFAVNLDAPATTGIAVFVLAVIGVVCAWRRPLARFAGLVWLVAFLVALGPRIAIGEHAVVWQDYERFGYTPFPMLVRGQPLSAVLPHSWLVQVPGLADFRVAQRFAMLAALPATLLAGLGLEWLLARRSRMARATVAPLLVIALLEMAGPVPPPENAIPVKRRHVYGPIRKDPSPSIVVDVPFGWVTAIRSIGVGYQTEPVLRAVEHGHPIANGFINRLSDARLETLASHPFYAGLLARQYSDPNAGPPWPTPHPPREPTIDEALADRERLGVGWVVLAPTADRVVIDYLTATGFVWSHAADGFVVYRVRRRPPNDPAARGRGES